MEEMKNKNSWSSSIMASLPWNDLWHWTRCDSPQGGPDEHLRSCSLRGHRWSGINERERERERARPNSSNSPPADEATIKLSKVLTSLLFTPPSSIEFRFASALFAGFSSMPFGFVTRRQIRWDEVDFPSHIEFQSLACDVNRFTD